MKKYLCLLLLLSLSANVCFAQNHSHKKHSATKSKPAKPEKPSEEQIIRKMLADQVQEWNKGSVEGYMAGYWDNDSMLFIGSAGPRYGFQKTLERYKEAYPDKAHMGKLTSTITSIQQLSKDYFFVVGKWDLKRKVGDVGGSYTLLLKKIDGNWVIVCDHSS